MWLPQWFDLSGYGTFNSRLPAENSLIRPGGPGGPRGPGLPYIKQIEIILKHKLDIMHTYNVMIMSRKWSELSNILSSFIKL